VTSAERTLVTIVGAFTTPPVSPGDAQRARAAHSLIAISPMGGVVVLVADGGVTTFRVIDIVLSAAVIIVL
jgi:hypothetical protein